MTRITTLIILLLFILQSSATIVLDQRSWEEGPLTWNDFRGNSLIKNEPAYMVAELLQNNSITTAGNRESFSISAKAIMYPSKSYADTAVRSEQLLRYFQLQFDLLELMRRRYQKELANGISGIEADRRQIFYSNLYETELKRLESETNKGTDDTALQFFEYEIRSQLENIGTPPIPNVVPSHFKYGFFVGTGAVWSLGELNDAFSWTWDFTFGLKASYRRFNLEALITYGNPSIKNPKLTNPQFADMNYYANTKNANYLAVGFNGGFSIIDNRYLSISPYIGGMWTSNSWTSKPMYETEDGLIIDGAQQKMDLSDFNLTFGINFEWHLHSVVTNFPFFGALREEYISSLRFTPYVVRAIYDNCTPKMSGWQIGFMVSYSGVARALGIK